MSTSAPIDLFADEPQPLTAATSTAPDFAESTLQSNELWDASTGEPLDVADIDALVDALERVRQKIGQFIECKDRINSALIAKATGTKKTRRVQGERRKVAIETPTDAWDGAKLEHLWATYPELREQVLKESKSYKVKLVEYKKLLETSGGPALDAFVSTLKAANRGPQGIPTVKIEQ